jgi:hypothetical protein
MDEEGIGDRQADRPLVEFNGKQRRLVFHGDCDEMRPVCEAMCCRMDWHIDITPEEFASGRIRSEVICRLSNKECQSTSPQCTNRRYQLARQEDGSCIHLRENRCSIYPERPKTCRDFDCRGGWVIATSVFPSDEDSLVEQPKDALREIFIRTLNNGLIFVLHPLIKLHIVVYRKSKKDVIFIKEMVGGCGKFNTQEIFDYPQLNDDSIMALIDLFNRKESLGQIYQRFCAQHPDVLTQQEFFEIVWLLNRHNIILDSSNFRGMLAGMGGIG